ncbi:MAG: DUF58 domain-containing protein, partial [bacterium]|nr:DUF58 domain-containing protein [bacterium]
MQESDIKRLRLAISKRIKNLYSGRFLSKSTSLRGSDFQEKRNFNMGDDPRAVNITSSIKEGRLKVTVKKAEKAANIFMVMDSSPSLLFGTTESKLSYTLNLASAVAIACLGDGNKIKFFTFTDKIEYAGNFVLTKQAVEDEISSILKLKPSGSNSNLNIPLKKIHGFLEEKAFGKPNMVFLFSDFLFDINFERALGGLAQMTDIVAFCVRDEIETKLPCLRLGLVKLTDMETGETVLARESHDFLDRINKVMKRFGIDIIEPNTYDETGKNLKKLAEL